MSPRPAAPRVVRPGRRAFLRVGASALAVLAWSSRGSGLAAQRGTPPGGFGRSLRLVLTYHVRDAAATARAWAALGGRVSQAGAASVVDVAGVRVRLQPVAGALEPSLGSVVDHVAFRVPALAPVVSALAAAGVRVEQPPEFPGVAQAYTPEGDKIEVFDNTSPYTGFDAEGAAAAASPASRHNGPVSGLAAHHLHFYLPEGADLGAREWYQRRFGGVAGRRYRYTALDFPAINLNFSAAPAPPAPTAGRTLDRIGFEVRGVEALARRLDAAGTTFTERLQRRRDGTIAARLVDPWGTSIEVVESAR